MLPFVLGRHFFCMLVPLKVTPHHARVSNLTFRLTINAIDYSEGIEDGSFIFYVLFYYVIICYMFSEATTTVFESFTDSTEKHVC